MGGWQLDFGCKLRGGKGGGGVMLNLAQVRKKLAADDKFENEVKRDIILEGSEKIDYEGML